MESKPFYTSKTLWANFILLGIGIYMHITGKLVDTSPEAIGGIIIGINTFLRFVTKGKVTIS